MTFAPLELTKTITVQILSDELTEGNETFSINLFNISNANTYYGLGVITIQDEDAPGKLSFSLAPYSVAENGGAASITVSRTNGSIGAVTVDYVTSNGIATAAQDYTATSGTLILPMVKRPIHLKFQSLTI